MSHVHGSGNLPVDSPGSDLVLFPQFLGVLRQSLHKSLVSEGLAVLHQSGVGNFVSQIVDIFAFGFDSPLFGDADQFLGIFYLVVAVSGRFIQGMADLPAMVGMGCGSACGKLQVISSYDAVYVAAADSSRCFRGDTAGTHSTDPAADAGLTKLTVRGLSSV